MGAGKKRLWLILIDANTQKIPRHWHSCAYSQSLTYLNLNSNVIPQYAVPISARGTVNAKKAHLQHKASSTSPAAPHSPASHTHTCKQKDSLLVSRLSSAFVSHPDVLKRSVHRMHITASRVGNYLSNTHIWLHLQGSLGGGSSIWITYFMASSGVFFFTHMLFFVT